MNEGPLQLAFYIYVLESCFSGAESNMQSHGFAMQSLQFQAVVEYSLSVRYWGR